ncbi:MAG: cytochrome C oxidase subunit I, partial [Halobacteriaceae archaeon]
LLRGGNPSPFEPTFGSIAEIQLQIAVGGTLLFVGLLMFLLVMAGTWFAQRETTQLNVNGFLPEPLSGVENSPRILDNLTLWTIIAILLILLAYGLPLLSMLSNGVLTPGSSPVPV